MVKITADEIDVKAIIPHRYPFLFADRVIEVVPGESITTSYYVDPDNPIFVGHFPGNPVFPGVLIEEAIAQATAIAILTKPEYHNLLPLLRGIENSKFTGIVRPRDSLTIMVSDIQIRRKGSMMFGWSTGRVDVLKDSGAKQVAIATIKFTGLPLQSTD